VHFYDPVLRLRHRRKHHVGIFVDRDTISGVMHRTVKSKPKAKLMVADGAGGLSEVIDRRFDRGGWPISFQVPTSEADDWFWHLQFEYERRGWSSAGMSQLQSRENSGSLTLLEAGVEKLSVVWDRARGGALNIRALPAADLDLADAQECFQRVNERSRAGATEPRYRWGILEYQGRAWRGELWLDDNVRLGPPSKRSFLLRDFFKLLI
jgi:hypothetical protein